VLPTIIKRPGNSFVKQWICVIAGGPDHGAVIPQWVDARLPMPEPLAGSDGVACPALAEDVIPGFFRIVMAHPTASEADRAAAGDVMHLWNPLTD
jgi:hypothetical protein